ncbi:MAG TPA: choice-of-anchor D domain-containing protein [Kofleriaceae bacterium]|nr:choice-of-anchor D domain-containing protein [Kofleriaceae bacterium]
MLALTACGGSSSGDDDQSDIDAAPPPIDAPTVNAHLSIDRDHADLGMVLVGDTTPTTMFTITNTGTDMTGELTATVTGAGFRKSRDTCNGSSLRANNTCQVTIDATPAAEGQVSGNLMVTASPGGDVGATLTATGLTAGMLTNLPDTWDFAMVTAGTMSAPKTITVQNTGGTATGLVVIQLGGPDAGEFQLVSNGCMGQALDPQATCDVVVRMTPGLMSSGDKAAMITATSNPGGSAVTMLTGHVVRPAILAVSGSGAFGGILVGTSATKTLTVSNTGELVSGAVTITRTGNAAFQVLTGMANDCVSGTTTLMPAATCDVRVQYTAGVPGPVVGTITASANPGGSAMGGLSGTGQRPAHLSGDLSPNFGNVEAGTLSTNSVTWTITNSGDQPTSVPQLMVNSPELVVANNGCTAAIPGAGTCNIMLKFQPSAGGARMGTATVSIMGGSSVMVTATATGTFRLSFTRNGDSGTVTSNPAGLNCAPPMINCTGLFAPGNVTLQARTTNGSFVYFGAWSGADAGSCAAGPNRDCVINITGPKAVTATFFNQTTNLAFIGSVEQPTNLGSAAAYDTVCNQLATAAGINDAGGASFMAWVSDAGSSALARLGNASGWVRMDSRVVAVDRSALVTNQRVLNPVRYSENGEDLGDSMLLTGTNADGTTAAGSTCANWTAVGGGSFTVGNGMGGPTFWTSGQTTPCSGNTYHILCMMKTSVAGPGAPNTFAGKKIWLSNAAYGPSPTGDVDAVCNADKPAGAASGRALLARTTGPASNLLTAGTMYVRPDGQEVGTGAELVAGLPRAGIWESSNGTYWSGKAWTGSSTIDAVGAFDSTCGDWTVAASSGRVTFPQLARQLWGQTVPVIVCNNIPADGPRLMCYEP